MSLRFAFRPLNLCSAGAVVLFAMSFPTAEAASFTNSFSQCYVSNVDSTSQTSTTPGVGSSATEGVCAASALADYGVLRNFSSSGGNPYQSTANSQFSIDYYLLQNGVPANTPITLNVPLSYHVIISASAGPFNGAAFSIFLDSAVAPFYSLNLVTSSDSFANNNCPNPLANAPKCNGEYSGVLNLSVPASINTVLPNRLWITANGSSTFGGLMDASNTVTLGLTQLPTGVTFSYPDLTGNPANFQLAATGVPEPATFVLAFAGLAAIGIKRLRAR